MVSKINESKSDTYSKSIDISLNNIMSMCKDIKVSKKKGFISSEKEKNKEEIYRSVSDELKDIESRLINNISSKLF